jgi:hypothetical protein
MTSFARLDHSVEEWMRRLSAKDATFLRKQAKHARGLNGPAYDEAIAKLCASIPDDCPDRPKTVAAPRMAEEVEEDGVVVMISCGGKGQMVRTIVPRAYA